MSERDDVIAGRYRLLDPVGRGGMGAVWRARDELLEREVAVKQLHVEPAEAVVGPSGLGHERAMREARITARLHHPHAVPVFDAVEHDGQPYLVMQYFPSRSLQEVLAERTTLPPRQVAAIGAEVASALAAAHRAGVVHRDVKPANVLVAADGTAKITDFGIAHIVGDESLTTTGVITGTPAYLAPEVARGQESTEASDVFSLGATLYRALEGHPPFPRQENQLALLHLIGSGAIVPPERSDGLTPLVLRMLAVDPVDRPPMDEVARGLREVDVEQAAVPATPPAADTAEPEGTAGPEIPTESMPPLLAALEGTPDPAETAVADDGDGDGPGGSWRWRWRSALALLALVLAILVAGAVAERRSGDGDGGSGDDASALNSEEAPVDPAGPATSAAAPSADQSTGNPTQASTGSAAGATEAPAPTTAPGATPASASTAPPAPSRTTAPPAGATPVTGSPTAAQAEEAIRRYYGLLPGDVDAGWALLTDRYRQTTARNRATYDAFWGGVSRVAVSDVAGSPSGGVTATITYSFTDGRTFVERTAYQLVRQDGVLKIDQSTVLSSSQR